ncbi:hypothetical protein [Nevskia soli]|uniref:hypothetical protein n=1 Tax=Nevskia soli TaxID=418856 RepID=UPI0015D86496|nr:hypothetical protein [Nevskia soli]
MNWKSVAGVLATVAPTIGAAVGGPLAGSAISALEGVLKITPKSPDTAARQEAIGTAIGAASPEQLLALKAADHEFSEHMLSLGFADAEALAKLATDDRGNARQREVVLRDWTPRGLAIGVTFGFFGLLVFMAIHAVPAESKDVLNILLGSLGAGWMAVISYYFGSSSENAAAKNAALNKDADAQSVTVTQSETR